MQEQWRLCVVLYSPFPVETIHYGYECRALLIAS